jgi:hypothetical protein
MRREQILNHFNNGDVVECIINGRQSEFNESTLFLIRDAWAFVDKNGEHIYVESNNKLATIIQPDKTDVYAQLGKEVEVILKANPNDMGACGLIRKLYGL